jgi:hypothetical protein
MGRARKPLNRQSVREVADRVPVRAGRSRADLHFRNAALSAPRFPSSCASRPDKPARAAAEETLCYECRTRKTFIARSLDDRAR